jgi:uncharacterized protein
MTWIQTYTGKAFDLLTPTPDMVCIEDIAHHLALINRFTGATQKPYSVAQHSVLVAGLVPAPLKLAALLHDAAEAYCTDISRPMKEAMRAMCKGFPTPYDLVVERVEEVIGRKFGVELVRLDPAIKHADMSMLGAERVHLHHSQPRAWDWEHHPAQLLPAEINPWSWGVAEAAFLAAFAELRTRRDHGRL